MNKLLLLTFIGLFLINIGFSDMYNLNDNKWITVFNDTFDRANSNTVGAEYIERENAAGDCAINSSVLRLTGSGGTWTHCALNFTLAGINTTILADYPIIRLSYNYTQTGAINIRTGFGNKSVWSTTFIETEVTGYFNEWNSRTTLKYLNNGATGATYYNIVQGSNNRYDFVINTANNNISYYVNGSLVGSQIAGWYGKPQDIYSWGAFDKTTYADIDNVVLYYYKENLTDGLMNYYKFDENTGINVKDEVSGNNITLKNNTAWVNGIINYGSNGSRATDTWAQQNSNVGISGANSWTVNTWVKFLTFDNDATIWQLGVGGTACNIGGIYYNSVTSSLKVQGWGCAGTGDFTPIPLNPTVNQWYMITVTYNGTGWKTYINGTLKAQAITPFTLTDNKFQINKLHTFTGYSINGITDELGIWNKVLTSGEITQLWNNGAGLPYSSFSGAIPPITNFNVTTITSNSSWLYSNSTNNYFTEFNTTNNFMIRTYNITGAEVNQSITLYSPDLGGVYTNGTNITSGTNFTITINNASLTSYKLNFTNPFNASIQNIVTIYIDEIESIILNSNTSRFYRFNTTLNLSAYGYHSFGLTNTTCNDNINLSSIQLNISNRVVPLCTNTSITLNNSNVYNYTITITHAERGSNITNTYYYYTNNYSLSSATYNATIRSNGTNLFETSIISQLNSTANASMKISYNGTISDMIANGTVNHFSFSNTPIINTSIENFTIIFMLNETLNGESLITNYTYYQLVANIQVALCNGTYTVPFININLKDEQERTTYVNGSIDIGVDLYGDIYAFYGRDQTNYTFCLKNAVNFTIDVDFTYYAPTNITNGVNMTQDDYGAIDKRTREYFIRDYNFNGSTINLNLFLLKTADVSVQRAEKIKFIILDSSDLPQENFIINVKRWYENEYELVAMAKTNYAGEALTYVDYLDWTYQVEVLNIDNEIVKTLSRSVFNKYENTIYIITSSMANPYLEKQHINYNYTWNNNTGVFAISIYDDRGVPINITVKAIGRLSDTVCDYSYYSASVTSACILNNSDEESYTINVNVGANDIVFNLFRYTIDEVARLAMGRSGLFYTFLIVMAFGLFGINISIQTVPILGCFGLLISQMLGFIQIDPIYTAGIFAAAVLVTVRFTR